MQNHYLYSTFSLIFVSGGSIPRISLIQIFNLSKYHFQLIENLVSESGKAWLKIPKKKNIKTIKLFDFVK